MKKAEALEAISTELRSNDRVVYAFLPANGPKHFIGQEVLVSTALVLLTAFLSGFRAGLESRLKDWGKSLGTWIGDRIQQLFEAKPTQASDGDLDAAIEAARGVVGAAPEDLRQEIAGQVESLLVATLETRGVLPARAAALAARVREGAVALAS